MRSITLLLLLCFAAPALAANWLKLFGNESPQAPRFRPIAIVQPTYTRVDAQPVSGLVGPLAAQNGRYSFNNQVLPDFERTEQFQLLRARLGARGKLTDQINYFALLEAGENPMTREQDLVLSSLSLTFNQIPGARVRAGLFKLPTDEEAMVAVNRVYPYTFFSTVVQNLLIEQPVDQVGTLSPSLSAANPRSGCNCFHDWGVQVYDWFQRGDWELAYAAVVSNGSEIDTPKDYDNNKDLTLRFQASRVFGGQGPDRQDLTLYAWHQQGKRRFGADDHQRLREGLGFRLNKRPIRLSAAFLRGEGMIVSGYNPPFTGSNLGVGIDEESDGWYLEGGWRFHPKWEFDLRFDRYDMMTANAINTRRLDTTTLGVQHFINKNTRVSLNYEWRDMAVSHPEAFPLTPAGRVQLNNAQVIADNLADRVSLQLSWSY